MMKKAILFVVLIGLLLSLTGCGGKQPETLREESTEPVFTVYDWPKSDIAKLIPQPKSNVGKVEWEASYGFVLYVAETSQEEYKTYVDECWDSGFTSDYNRGDDYFWANNDDGYKLTLRYQEGNVMFVRMDEPDGKLNVEETSSGEDLMPAETQVPEVSEVMPTETQTPEESEVTQAETQTPPDKVETLAGIRPEFKEAMDSYEAFFDEYCAFMKTYTESDDVTAMLTEYAKYMAQYAETMAKMNELEKWDLSAEETEYYADMTARISQKLLAVAQ